MLLTNCHKVTGLAEVVVTCGACREMFTQPINPSERLSWLVCPHCNASALTRFAWNLLDEYEPREDG